MENEVSGLAETASRLLSLINTGDRKSDQDEATPPVPGEPIGIAFHGKSNRPSDAEELRKDFAIQERILAELQRENEQLFLDKKALHSENRSLQDALANLQAKHSLLLSSKEQLDYRQRSVDTHSASPIVMNAVNLQEASSLAETAKDVAAHQSGGVDGHCGADVGSMNKQQSRPDCDSSPSPDNLNDCALRPDSTPTRCVAENDSLRRRISQVEMALQEKDLWISRSVQKHRDQRVKMEQRHLLDLEALRSAISSSITSEQSSRMATLEGELSEAHRKVERLTSSSTSLNDELNERNAQLEALKAKNSELRKKLDLANDSVESLSEAKIRLEAQLASLQDEQTIRAKHLSETEIACKMNQELFERRIANLQRDYSLELSDVRKQHNSALSKLENQHREELRILSESHPSKLSQDVSRELAKIQVDGTTKSFLKSVLDRLCFIESRYKQKERELQYELDEVKRIAEFELVLEKQKTEAAIEEKYLQIHDFRSQLDVLIGEITKENRSIGRNLV